MTKSRSDYELNSISTGQGGRMSFASLLVFGMFFLIAMGGVVGLEYWAELPDALSKYAKVSILILVVLVGTGIQQFGRKTSRDETR